MIIDAWNQLDNIYLGRQSRPKLRHQVVMFQADVDSWWNLSLGHAIPAFVPWHELLAGGWARGEMALWSSFTHDDKWNLYAWTSTALCFWSLKRSRNYILHFWKRKNFMYTYNSYTNLTQAWELIDQRPLLRCGQLRSHCCGARNYFWAGSLLDASGPDCTPLPSLIGDESSENFHDINGGFCGQPCLVIGG